MSVFLFKYYNTDKKMNDAKKYHSLPNLVLWYITCWQTTVSLT